MVPPSLRRAATRALSDLASMVDAALPLSFAGRDVRRIVTALKDLECRMRKRQDQVGSRHAFVARFSLGVQAGQKCPILVQIKPHGGEFENCGIARQRLGLGCSPCVQPF